MNFKHFYDQETGTLTYIVYNDKLDAVIIDPVLNLNYPAGKITTENVSEYINYINDNSLNLHYILETHVHADHLTASAYLKEKFPNARIAISKHITEVQKTFKDIFKMNDHKCEGSEFDHLLSDNEYFNAGELTIQVIETPGHTPACVCFQIENHLFTGDSIFMEDFGTGRCDFPKGSAKNLFKSIKEKIYSLPNETIILVGHDYGTGGREIKFQTTLGSQKENNKHVKTNTKEEEFLSFRHSRDKELNVPRLLYPSLQVNMLAGKIPQYFIIPVKD